MLFGQLFQQGGQLRSPNAIIVGICSFLCLPLEVLLHSGFGFCYVTVGRAVLIAGVYVGLGKVFNFPLVSGMGILFLHVSIYHLYCIHRLWAEGKYISLNYEGKSWQCWKWLWERWLPPKYPYSEDFVKIFAEPCLCGAIGLLLDYFQIDSWSGRIIAVQALLLAVKAYNVRRLRMVHTAKKLEEVLEGYTWLHSTKFGAVNPEDSYGCPKINLLGCYPDFDKLKQPKGAAGFGAKNVVSEVEDNVPPPRPLEQPAPTLPVATRVPTTPTEHVKVTCSGCGKVGKADARLVGQQRRCPVCQHVLRIPEPQPQQTPTQKI